MEIKLLSKPKFNLETTALHTTSPSSYDNKNCGGYKRSLMSVNLFLEAKEKQQGPSHKDSTLELLRFFPLFQLNLDSQQVQCFLGIFITFFKNVKNL